MVTPRSGFDLEYYLGRAGEKTAGGYYLNAAQQGEPPGRWFGKGAKALGLPTGSSWSVTRIWRCTSRRTRSRGRSWGGRRTGGRGSARSSTASSPLSRM